MKPPRSVWMTPKEPLPWGSLTKRKDRKARKGERRIR